MNPGDWACRMKQVVQKIDAAITQIGKLAERPLWADSGAHCSHMIEATADAVELSGQGGHGAPEVCPQTAAVTIAGLAAEFCAQRPDESALAQRIAALNGDNRACLAATHEFRPPPVPDMRFAVRRVAGTLDLWAFEIEKRDDGMAGADPRARPGRSL